MSQAIAQMASAQAKLDEARKALAEAETEKTQKLAIYNSWVAKRDGGHCLRQHSGNLPKHKKARQACQTDVGFKTAQALADYKASQTNVEQKADAVETAKTELETIGRRIDANSQSASTLAEKGLTITAVENESIAEAEALQRRAQAEAEAISLDAQTDAQGKKKFQMIAMAIGILIVLTIAIVIWLKYGKKLKLK